VGGEGLLKAFEYANTNEGSLSTSEAYAFLGLVLMLLIIQFGFTIWLGLKPGESRENRFGPPPGDLFAR
jgi:hypothetical protein